MDENRKNLEDLAKATTVVFVMLEEENYFLAQTHDDNPEIPASEIVVLTIKRMHRRNCADKNCPLFDYAGAIGYVSV